MVIVKLMGGLGNQMFQYAAGRSLAHQLKTQLKLDLSFYKEVNQVVIPREYELKCFRLKVGFVTKKEVDSFHQLSTASLDKLASLLKKLGVNRSRITFREKHYHFDPDFFSLRGDVYLEGYWQSEKYFHDIADIIRRDFHLKKPPLGKNKQLAGQITRTTSVSIHVRRTDYVTDKTTNKFHGTCGLDYYRRCIGLITKRVKKPTFFVFSDDPDWTKKNLKTKLPTAYVAHNQGKGWEDQRLMGLCQHNILANSSFSWWGAWLNSNPAKIVLTPKRWFDQAPYNTKDLRPKAWLKISA